MSSSPTTSAVAAASPRSDASDAADQASLRPLGALLLLLSVALVGNTVVGPLVMGTVDYPISESMLNQLLGLELVTVLLVAPATATCGVLAWRERPAAPLLALGPTAYAAYMFAQYVVGPLYARYSVTVLLHLGIATLAGILVIWSWSRAIGSTLSPPAAHGRWARTAWLCFLGVFVLLRYVALFTGAAGGDTIPAEFLDEPAFYWSIVLLDLGIVVPLTFIAAGAMLRGTRTSQHAYYGVVGWFALVPTSVAAMAAVMIVSDDPHASMPTLVLTACASIVFAVPAIAAVREISREGRVAP